MSNRNFFSELKRRNVYKVAVAYAVVAWLLVQAASILFPTFEAPPWVMKVFVAVIVLGFPIALVFSWAFEITPQGNQKLKQENRSRTIPDGGLLVLPSSLRLLRPRCLFFNCSVPT
jgi:hypothetical protein